MATWGDLTHEQKIRLMMETFGVDEARAEREVAIADGSLDPSDVVGGLPPAEPLGVDQARARP